MAPPTPDGVTAPLIYRYESPAFNVACDRILAGETFVIYHERWDGPASARIGSTVGKNRVHGFQAGA